MQAKRIVQTILDIGMLLLLPVLMAYSLVGEALHEWLGGGIFLLFLLHHILNWRWFRNLFRGRYSPQRCLFTVLNVLLIAIMLVLPISGLAMEKHLPFTVRFFDTSTARILHLLASYWGFILMSVHLGLHWSIFRKKVQNALRIQKESPVYKAAASLFAVLTGGYGIYVFIKRQIGSYLLLKNQFVFFDYQEPVFFFLLDYLCVLFLFAAIGYYGMKLLGKIFKKRSPGKTILSSQTHTKGGLLMDKKPLVTYFSVSGVTKRAASDLAKMMVADLFEIIPELPYQREDLDWTNPQSRSTVEMKNPASRPAIQGHVTDMDAYDVVYVGFPIWWYVAPTIINTFLESYDLSGKKVVLFATSGGSGFGDTVKALKNSVSLSADIIEGAVFRGRWSAENLKMLAEKGGRL